jgi:hypothetical protein
MYCEAKEEVFLVVIERNNPWWMGYTGSRRYSG